MPSDPKHAVNPSIPPHPADSLSPVSSPAAGLVPIHIGQPEPASERERQLLLQLQRLRDSGRAERSPRVPAGLDWAGIGFQPRWLGMDTSDCAVAINPSNFRDEGADEQQRFLTGAAQRGERAVVIAVMGDAGDRDDGRRNVFGEGQCSVSVGDMNTRVAGRRLLASVQMDIAPGLSAADRNLALRLKSARPPDAPWWALDLYGVTTLRPTASYQAEAKGHLEPILLDALGNPVAAVWVSPADDQRWYIVPDATPWPNLLDWVIQTALPAYAPAVLRRARSPHFMDPDLQTTDELAARQALADLETRHTEERTVLQQRLDDAAQRADPVRYGLLYGAGGDLAVAVAAVFTAAGLHAVDLDQDLGGTQSADLLVSASHTAARLLVEVKSHGTAAQESFVSQLQRQLDAWPQLRPDVPVAGGVLIVNHHTKLPPTDRPVQVYSRQAFVDSLRVKVFSTVQLFEWWRVDDWAAIRANVLGIDPPTTPAAPPPTTPPQLDNPPLAATRPWRWRRRRSETGTA